MSILRPRRQQPPASSPVRKGQPRRAAHFEYQKQFSIESRSVGVGYGAEYASPAPKLPKLTPLAEDDDSPWRRTSEACGGHYRRPDLVASFSASSLGAGAGMHTFSSPSSSAGRAPLHDVLGAVDTMSERHRVRGSAHLAPSPQPPSQSSGGRGSRRAAGEAAAVPAPAQDGAPPRPRPHHQAPSGPMGIVDFSRPEAGVGGAGDKGRCSRHVSYEDMGSEIGSVCRGADGVRGGAPTSAAEGGGGGGGGRRTDAEQQQQQRRKRAAEERQHREEPVPLYEPYTPEGAPRAALAHEPLLPPPPLQLSPAGKQHASALHRQHQIEERHREEAHARFHRERDQRRSELEHTEEQQRTHLAMRQQQALLEEDPNAFDRGLVQLYRKRNSGSETAALLTNRLG